MKVQFISLAEAEQPQPPTADVSLFVAVTLAPGSPSLVVGECSSSRPLRRHVSDASESGAVEARARDC